MDNVLDIVDQNTAYEPVLTRQKQRLLYSLSPFVLASENTFKQNMRIVNRRLELICDHCRELTRKRYAKAHRRLSRVHAKNMDPMDEAQELLRLELLDKKLNAEPNYAPDEPEEYEYVSTGGKDIIVIRTASCNIRHVSETFYWRFVVWRSSRNTMHTPTVPYFGAPTVIECVAMSTGR